MQVLNLELARERNECREEEYRAEIARRLKEMRKRARRFLRCRIHVARYMYDCDYCTAPIDPGDQYERLTFVNHYRFSVERKHYPVCLGPTHEEDADIHREMEEERQMRERRSSQAA